jgi:phosphoribosylaminoimidazole-succinocarboxamide synthase
VQGRGQDSFDKQFLRDWLTRGGLQGKDGVEISEEIVVETGKKYLEVYEILTDLKWQS